MVTWVNEYASGVVLTQTTTRADGDFRIDAEPTGLAQRRRQVADRPWVWLRQVHGNQVVTVTAANAAEVAGGEADALVTDAPDLVLSVHTADCVPLVLWSPTGVIGAVHAGWRGLEAGVVEAAWSAMTDLGAVDIQHHIGPHIGVECYEFGAGDLDRLVERFGPRVRGTTLGNRPALDLQEATRAVIERLTGRPSRPRPRAAPEPSPTCTACEAGQWFSHRARAETERMATVIWRESSPDRALSVTGP